MDQGIYTAASGARAMEERLAVITNNMANAGTVGFKKDALSFEQFMRPLRAAGLEDGEFSRVPIDVVTGEEFIDTSAGPYRETGNPLDVAITGDGFFVINTLDGPRYTRAGSFHLSPEGLLVDAHGQTVQGEGGDIELGPGQVHIAADGAVYLNDQQVDTLQVVDIDQADLSRTGTGKFAIRQGAVPGELETPSVRQGVLEQSNVEPVIEMVGLISTQRAYEAFHKVMRTLDESYKQSIRNVGTLA